MLLYIEGVEGVLHTQQTLTHRPLLDRRQCAFEKQNKINNKIKLTRPAVAHTQSPCHFFLREERDVHNCWGIFLSFRHLNTLKL